MTGCITQIDEAPLRQKDKEIVLIIASIDFVDLRFNLFPTPMIAHELSVNFGVEVPDVADDGMLCDGSQ